VFYPAGLHNSSQCSFDCVGKGIRDSQSPTTQVKIFLRSSARQCYFSQAFDELLKGRAGVTMLGHVHQTFILRSDFDPGGCPLSCSGIRCAGFIGTPWTNEMIADGTTAQRIFVEYDHMVQTFSANRPDDPFHISALTWRPWGAENIFNAHDIHLFSKLLSVDSITSSQ